MDNFNGITNEDFIAYFLLDLNCRKELTQYTYPNEKFEEQGAIDDHIVKCQDLLSLYLNEIIYANRDLKTDERNAIVDKKLRELYPLLEPYIEQYITEVKVSHVNFWPDNRLEKDH